MYSKRVIHTGRLFQVEQVSPQMGKRVFGELKARGEIAPEATPSGREYVSAAEAEIISLALRQR